MGHYPDYAPRLVAFVLDTVAGLLFGKFLTFASRGTINPLIGAAGLAPSLWLAVWLPKLPKMKTR